MTTTAVSGVRIARARVLLETRLFLREPQQVVFSFLYPAIMMVIFGSVFRGQDIATGGVSYSRYFLAGIAATGIMLTSFQAVAIDIANDRDDGTLVRLQATTMPTWAYFVGKLGQVLVTTVAQLTLLLAVARLLFSVPLPADLAHWLTFVWVGLLGASAGVAIGVAAAASVGPVRKRCDRADCAGAAIFQRRVLRLRAAAGLDAGRRRGVPAEVDDAGHAVRATARKRGPRRGGPRLAARSDRPCTRRLGHSGRRDGHPYVPVAPAMRRVVGWLRPDRGGEPMTGRSWTATIVGLHVFGAAILSLAFITTVVGDGHHDGVAAVAVAVLAVGYLLVGARCVGAEAPARAMGYLALLVAVLGVVGWSDPSILFLLTLAYPQVWFLVEGPRPGLIWTGLLAGASSVGLATGLAQRGASPLAGVADSAVGLIFSVAMGLWVGRVLTQSRERAALIATLEQTRAELARAHHEQGVMAERERLAREVHDTVAQGYTSVVVLAQTAESELAQDPERARDRLRLMAEIGRDNLREIRAIVAAFSPAALDGSTLVEALRRLGERFARETGIAVEVEVESAPVGLARGEEVVLLRTAQEALSNARRHAQASRVRLVLAQEDHGVVVRVIDDGRGFDATAAAGFGLAGLDERIRQAGGALKVDSAPGRGTILAARLPVAR